MLRFEDSLPRLPVPSIEDTSKRYLKSVRPLLSKEEFAATEKAVTESFKSGSIGEKLQQRLLARRDHPKQKNWIAEWWNDAAYLSYRDPVVPYVSYFYSFRDDRRRRNPAKRAAALTTAALEFKKNVDAGTLEPEYMKKLPMSMTCYQYMFNCSRVAAEGLDYPIMYDHKGNEHIIAIRKNQFYKIPTHVDGKQLNTSELEQQFNLVYQRASKVAAIGSTTSLPRDDGVVARKNLLDAAPPNAAALEAIESSSFVVCLDEAAPITLAERAHQYWHGDGKNRWFDKPLQFIINDNGTAGFQGEHSMMDGTPTHRLCDTVNNLIVNNRLDFDNPSIRSNLPEPTALRFELSEAVERDLEKAAAHFRKVMNAHELQVQAYKGYGKALIKKFRCSPDAYVQMVIQLAYHKMYGKNRPTYESAATRKFQLGRTETTRSCSEESVAWCDAMADPQIGQEECEKLFRTAVNTHVANTVLASDGQGVDRHLFGLQKLLEEGEEVPPIFTDQAYSYSSSWYISSSQLSSEYFNGYGWSQVIDQGWGIAYMINENR